VLTLWYRQPAKDFLAALPLGNGSLGAMVHGRVVRERIDLNADTLWSGGPGDRNDVSEMAAKVRPKGGGGDYGTGGGLDHLGFGTLAFTRDKAIVSATTPTPSASTPDTASSSDTAATPTSDASSGTQPQGGRGDDLAATGTGGIAAAAATGVLAIAGGLIALRRRGTRGSS
jgi:hypothetical protein